MGRSASGVEDPLYGLLHPTALAGLADIGERGAAEVPHQQSVTGWAQTGTRGAHERLKHEIGVVPLTALRAPHGFPPMAEPDNSC